MSIVTLVPAFKPDFLPQALDCLERQDVLPGRIIISDDSPDGRVTAATRAWLEARPAARITPLVECLAGPRQGAHANVVALMAHEQVEQSDSFHVCFDDDVLDRAFYRVHLETLTRHPGCLSLNKRHFVDSHGAILDDNHYPAFVNDSREETLLLGEREAYGSTIPRMVNWFGELTNCVFPAASRHVLDRMQFDDGICYYGLGDIGEVLREAQAGRVVFVNRYLSAFRQSSVHTTAKRTSNVCLASLWAWWAIAIHARRSHRVSQFEYEQFLRPFRSSVRKSAGGPATDGMRRAFAGHGRNLPAAEDDFLAAWREFLEGFPEGHLALHGSPAAGPAAVRNGNLGGRSA